MRRNTGTVMLGLMLSMPLAFASNRLANLNRIVDSERAFAARAQVVNARQAFVEYFAADAIAYMPFPGPAFPELLEGPDWPVNIQWRPVAAEVSGAGDMGYTTGPTEYRKAAGDPPTKFGHYTSVWRREPLGDYRVVIDVGIHHPAPPERIADWQSPLESPAARAPLAPQLRQTAERAMREIDARTGSKAGEDPVAAFAAVLATNVRLHLGGRLPAVGRAAVLATLAELGEAFTWSPAGAAIAESGDFGFAYGRGRLKRTAPRADGDLVYLNIWQRQADAWRLLVHVSHEVPTSTPRQ